MTTHRPSTSAQPTGLTSRGRRSRARADSPGSGPVRSRLIGAGRFGLSHWATILLRGVWCGIPPAPGSGDRRQTGDATNHSTVLARSAHLLRQRYGREGHRAREVPGRPVLPHREVLRVLGLATQKDLLTDHPRGVHAVATATRLARQTGLGQARIAPVLNRRPGRASNSGCNHTSGSGAWGTHWLVVRAPLLNCRGLHTGEGHAFSAAIGHLTFCQ